MDEPGTFDNIRRDHAVYITNVKPNVLEISCTTIVRLKSAIQAINSAIHELRLSNDHPTVQFYVQQPLDAVCDSAIVFKLASRPHFVLQSLTCFGNTNAVDEHLEKFCADMSTSANTLTALNKALRMRVNFGRLNIRQRMKGMPEEIPFAEFVRMMNIYSSRGGASLETKYADLRKVEAITDLDADFPALKAPSRLSNIS